MEDSTFSLIMTLDGTLLVGHGGLDLVLVVLIKA